LKDINISDINWKVIYDNLPVGHDDNNKNKRKDMFKRFDPNGNGYISLAEIDKGFNDMGESMRVIYSAKAVMMRAF
jgi:Ca2+-binding EF-hand superfamily protein